jgi:hypothetical protein
MEQNTKPTDVTHTSNRGNGALDSRRWQPRTELRDDLPLLDPRLGHPELTEPKNR